MRSSKFARARLYKVENRELTLLVTKVLVGCLHGDVTKQKLDLV